MFFQTLLLFIFGICCAACASNASIVTPPCEGVKNFTQLIDHTEATSESSSNGTFLQRYQLDTSSYRPGGPILFYQGNEGVSITCIKYLVLPEWAKELGAAVATIEHRFFGTSLASNATDPAVRFKTLTPENVMLDSVRFIEWVKSTVPGANDSKVIVQGASYGATLSTWLRQNHPNTFWGAISSAPALRSLNPPLDDPVNYGYMSFQSMIYSYFSSEAAKKIRDAIVAFQARIASKDGLAGLQSDFNLCKAPNSTSEVQTLLGVIGATYEIAAKCNFGSVQRAIGGSSIIVGYPFPNPLQALVDRTVSIPANDSTAILNASVALYMEQFGPCVDTTINLFPAIETSVYSYISCAYLPGSHSATLPGGVFPPVSVNSTVSAAAAACKEQYNITPPTQEELQRKYNFTQSDIESATRLLIVAHEWDPTTANGPAPWSPGPSPSESRVQWIGESGHCEDTYATQPGDRETLIKVSLAELFSRCWLTFEQGRAEQLEIIKSWLNDDV